MSNEKYSKWFDKAFDAKKEMEQKKNLEDSLVKIAIYENRNNNFNFTNTSQNKEHIEKLKKEYLCMNKLSSLWRDLNVIVTHLEQGDSQSVVELSDFKSHPHKPIVSMGVSTSSLVDACLIATLKVLESRGEIRYGKQ
ncbi:MAG: hypothetical protein GY909_15630 [Oligoflexia bacterium]|nr:hypothetical protein [Oligoflexia bacterium]